MPTYYVYFLASRPGGAIYVGVTNDLVRRIHEHKRGFVKGHTKRYRKTRVIAQDNPTRRDLYDEVAGAVPS